MFALSLGYSILRGIMHSLSLSAALGKKETYTQIEKCNRSSVPPTFPLDKAQLKFCFPYSEFTSPLSP